MKLTSDIFIPCFPCLLQKKCNIRGLHRCILSEIADFFYYLPNPLLPPSQCTQQKKIKSLISNTQYEKCLNAKSSLKQIQDATFLIISYLIIQIAQQEGASCLYQKSLRGNVHTQTVTSNAKLTLIFKAHPPSLLTPVLAY